MDAECTSRFIAYALLSLLPGLVTWTVARAKLRRARLVLAAAEAKERAAAERLAQAEDMSERLARALGLVTR